MRFITVKQLQRDFGLPFTTAERILREQMALAQRHYRRWNFLVFAGLSASLACNFAADGSPVHIAGLFGFSLSMFVFSAVICMARRHAQAPILAAARAAAARPAD